MELLHEYCQSLKNIRQLIRQTSGPDDLSTLRSMERDLEWTIEYMVTGYPSKVRSRRTIPVDPQKVLVHFSEPLHEPTLQIEKIRIQLLTALDILSPQEREAFLMVKGEGLSYGETADLMGISKSTVQDYVNRAKAKISKRRQGDL